ncbi:MAG: NAD(P)/FAD-dependent oxidoreductase [Leptospiraceae bacterium]|nr:NAD(P)/FAD-dependent oxidoreductase [Leptospiraceae bacterium]
MSYQYTAEQSISGEVSSVYHSLASHRKKKSTNRLPVIVIIGAGFGGLHAARELRKANARIILIDRNNYHLFQPLLYQVATAALSPDDIAEPIRKIFKDQSNLEVVMGNVEQIDCDGRCVQMADGNTIEYDALIVAAGSRHHYFGKSEWSRHAPGLKTIPDALKIREKILRSLEKAELMESPEQRKPYLNFVVIGGGPTGVEMAGAIAEITRRTMAQDFRHIHPEHAQITLLEGMPRLLPGYPEELSEKARRQLEDMGVIVHTDLLADKVEAHGVQAKDRWFPARNIIWAAGNKGRSILQTLDAPMDSSGRIEVGPDLTVPDHPEIFVIGDAACVHKPGGGELPALAPVAIQQGRYVARMLRSGTPTEQRPAFEYKDRGMMATIGRARAVARVGRWKMGGAIAWLLWSFVHVAFLIGFRNRVSVMLKWLWSYLTFQRSARLIVGRNFAPKEESR